MRTAFLVLAIVSLGPGVAAQTRPRLQPNPASIKPGWERWQTEVPVSGGVRVGVMSAGDRRLDLRSLTVFLPAFTEPTLCIELSTQDGRYSARLEYPLRPRESGPVFLDLPTQYARELAGYEPRQLAILASLNANCMQAPQAYVAARWGDAPMSDAIIVLLNSRLPTRIRGGADGALSFDCLPLDGVTTAYNLACEIPRVRLAGGPPLVVEMRRGGGVTRLPLPVRLP
jgi:hypothetical protein